MWSVLERLVFLAGVENLCDNTVTRDSLRVQPGAKCGVQGIGPLTEQKGQHSPGGTSKVSEELCHELR